MKRKCADGVGRAENREMIKKAITAAIAALLCLAVAPAASAAVNRVTPSTNDINAAKNWAHFTVDESRPGEVDVTFAQPRAFSACFEFRVDGEPPIADAVNYNLDVTDGLWDFICLKSGSDTRTFLALESLEIRMVFGAEGDERFDWTEVPVPPMTREACVENWAAHGFANQGGCVALVRANPNSRR